eukprot:CAMPEP_0170640056 /NCGR_PEP_ID=MMETSP0224-20130122/39997_1 /TAXON_ID=285029 /ORGANISM="Togula jolla, Strain CCCM 725" /LENGTH=99 /DNA_ID=CAMNT_0010970489 /DNA_START=11 /DNA_END=306 /DNA_ORIENTATION=+
MTLTMLCRNSHSALHSLVPRQCAQLHDKPEAHLRVLVQASSSPPLTLTRAAASRATPARPARPAPRRAPNTSPDDEALASKDLQEDHELRERGRLCRRA